MLDQIYIIHYKHLMQITYKLYYHSQLFMKYQYHQEIRIWNLQNLYLL